MQAGRQAARQAGRQTDKAKIMCALSQLLNGGPKGSVADGR